MAVTVTNLANDVSLTENFSTGTISWAAGSRGVIVVAVAYDVGPPQLDFSAAGGGVTWTPILQIDYSTRRSIALLVSDGTPTDGAISIGSDGPENFQEAQWTVNQVQGFDAAQWPTTGTSAENTGSSTSLNAPDVGTIAPGDLVLFGVGFENGANNLQPAAGSTQVVKRTGGGNVRSLLVASSVTDDTPGATWDSTGNGAGIVAILIKAAAAAAPVGNGLFISQH